MGGIEPAIDDGHQQAAVGWSGGLAALWHITPSGITIQGFSDVEFRSINDNQEIVAQNGSGDVLLFTIQSDGSVTRQLLKTFPPSQVVLTSNINNAGAIVGTVLSSTTVDEYGEPVFDFAEAFVLTKDGQMTILPPLATGGTDNARGINDRFQIVGSSGGHAVLWTPLMTGGYGITTLGDNADALNINEAGRIVGAARIAGTFGTHAALWWIIPAEAIKDLVTLVRSFSLQPQGIETSLVTKLLDTLAAINVEDLPTACTTLNDFINQVRAQSGKKITVAQANQLITAANQIGAALGCP